MKSHLEHILHEFSNESIHIIDGETYKGNYAPLDLSKTNTALNDFDITDANAFEAYINDILKQSNASIAYGAIKSALISEYLATKGAQYLGITADDILAYDLPSDELTKQDLSALDSELTDPRFNTGYWKDQINLMKEIGKKAEQQSLAKYGLDFVTDTYLPEKLADIGLGY